MDSFPWEGMGGLMLLLIVIAAIWSAVWKGIALWRAGKNSHLGWFIAMFIVNSLGILEIIYIFGFSRKKQLFDKTGLTN